MLPGIRVVLTLAVAVLAGAAGGAERLFSPPLAVPTQRRPDMPTEKVAGSFVLERDQDVAREEPGTHLQAPKP